MPETIIRRMKLDKWIPSHLLIIALFFNQAIAVFSTYISVTYSL